MSDRSPLVVAMGVSGSGKTTVGAALAQRLRVPFADADDFHPPANIAKMTAGAAQRRRPPPLAARRSGSGCTDARRDRRRDELLGAEAEATATSPARGRAAPCSCTCTATAR